ncbi:MAG TPA: VCBS repeat-containing protein [Myxococcales bacterium]|nr:VCBS repeat-containing protein [Myxococcales bacterium]
MRRTRPSPFPLPSRAVLFTALCAFAACQNQCFQPPPESVLSVSFTRPTDAQVLTTSDDLDPDAPGLQINMAVKASDSLDRAVTLQSAVLQARLSTETAFLAGPAAQLPGDDTASFPSVTLRQGLNVLQVTVTETGSGRTAVQTITVDAQPGASASLSVSFTRPTDGQVITILDDAVPGTAGLQYDVAVKAADSLGRPVTLAGATVLTRLSTETTFAAGPSAQLSGDTATFPAVDLRPGMNVLQVAVTDTRLGRNAIRTITVDAQAGQPQVLTFRFQGDANLDSALNQAEQSTGAPVAVLTVQGVEDGQTLTIKDQGASGTAYGTGTVTGGQVTVTLNGLGVTDTTESSFQLVASVADRLGRTNVIANPTPSQPLNTAAFQTLVVDRVPPALTLLSPNVPGTSRQLNMVDDADSAAGGFQVRVTVLASADVGTGGVTVTHTPPGTVDVLTPDPTTHQATVDFTVPDAGPFDYTVVVAVADPAGNSRSRTFTLQIGGGGSVGFISGLGFSDFTFSPPAFKFDVRRSVPVGGAQAIVGATNAFYWGANTQAEIPSTVIVDQDLATAGAQVTVTATVAGGATCTPQLLFNGNPVPGATGAALATDSPGAVTLSGTLTSGTSGPLRFVADCGGGRVFGLPPTSLTVDVDPPSLVPATLTLVNTGAFSDRKPAVDVAWTASNDDGSSGQGSASGYEVRWGTNATLKAQSSVSPLPADLYDRRPGIDSDARYWDSNRTRLPSGGTLPSTATSFRLTGLPPIEDYFIQVRASDDVGNLSPLAPTDCATGAGCLPHQLRLTTLNNPGTTGLIGYVMEAADFNGDGAADLAFTSIGTRTAWVAYGGSTPFTTTQQVVLPISPLAPTAPYSIAVGNVGDAAGGSFPDLAVSDPTWSTSRGRSFIFFGRAGTLDPAPIEFRGPTPNMSSGTGSGASTDVGVIRILSDFGSPGGGPPDGRDEVAISANNDNGGIGRVYLFYGRPHDVAAAPGSWEALTTTEAGDTTRFISLASADRIFDGEGPPSGTGVSFFGIRLGYASLGDITGDGVPDFTLPNSMSSVNRLYLFSGSSVNGSPTASVAAGTRLQRIDETPVTDASWRGFGSFALGGLDLIGGLGKDLAVGYPLQSRVQIYRDGNASGFDTTSANVLKIVGRTSSFGRGMAVADLNQDGQPDLVVATNACVSLCSDGFTGGAWVFYNRRPATPEYDLSSDDAAFSTTRLMRDFSATGSSDGLGLGIATGDFNGDGIPDIAVSDPVIPSAPGRGKVYVRY